jgi:hypothetical protein
MLHMPITYASKQRTGTATAMASLCNHPQLVNKLDLLADGRFLVVCHS